MNSLRCLLISILFFVLTFLILMSPGSEVYAQDEGGPIKIKVRRVVFKSICS